MMSAPTTREIAAAFRGGASVRLGVPTKVQCAGGVAVADLAAVARGDPDPWVITSVDGVVVDIQSASDRGLYVGDMPVTGENLAAVEAALRASRGIADADRHSPAGDAARLRAGECAMRVRDTMLRARLLDHVEGWAAICQPGQRIDSDPRHGDLYDPPKMKEGGFICRLLSVICPSTGRRYVLPVPATHTTARDARLWTLGVTEDPDAES